MSNAEKTSPCDPVPESIAREAEATIQDRMVAYGPPEATLTMTARLWSDFLRIRIDAHTVCVLNVLQKIARECHDRRRSNRVDIIGYTILAEGA
jgi:hypothetical protein